MSVLVVALMSGSSAFAAWTMNFPINHVLPTGTPGSGSKDAGATAGFRVYDEEAVVWDSKTQGNPFTGWNITLAWETKEVDTEAFARLLNNGNAEVTRGVTVQNP